MRIFLQVRPYIQSNLLVHYKRTSESEKVQKRTEKGSGKRTEKESNKRIESVGDSRVRKVRVRGRASGGRERRGSLGWSVGKRVRSTVGWDVSGGRWHCRIEGRRSGERAGGEHERASGGRGFGRVGRGSPYNHPPLRKASTRCLVHERDWAEGDGAESHGSDAAGGSWVTCMEFRYFIRGIADISGVFPGIAFRSVAFPFDQILETSAVHPTVQDPFHYVLFFPIDEFRRRGRTSTSADDPVSRGACQFHDVEDRVQALH